MQHTHVDIGTCPEQSVAGVTVLCPSRPRQPPRAAAFMHSK